MSVISSEIRLLEIGDDEFREISSMVRGICGINLHEGKKELVRARLSKRIRELRLPGFSEYVELVKNDQSHHEFSNMVDALTTNKTEFFRESAHFDFLKNTVFPEIDGTRTRIWSAGCSSGEEPYSIAIMLDSFCRTNYSDFRILATDISSRILAKAKEGVYRKNTIATVPDHLRKKSFTSAPGAPGMFRISPHLRRMVDFARLNLMEEWPMQGPFDIIFCRNVMIYFNKKIQQKLIDRFYGILRPGGYLFSGHSESLAGLTHSFSYVQPAVYRK